MRSSPSSKRNTSRVTTFGRRPGRKLRLQFFERRLRSSSLADIAACPRQVSLDVVNARASKEAPHHVGYGDGGAWSGAIGQVRANYLLQCALRIWSKATTFQIVHSYFRSRLVPVSAAGHFAYLIRDDDRAYGHIFTSRVRAMGIRDRPISPGSPWQQND